MATRNTSNRLVETLDNTPAHRDIATNGPAMESANARVGILGPFRRADVAVSLAAAALTAGGVDAGAPVGILAHSAGKIVSVTYKFSANVTAGGATAAQLQATVAPAATLTAAAQGDITAVASGGSVAQAGVSDQSAEVSFAKGDSLGVALTTSGTFAPTTADLDVYLVVRWAPSALG